MIYFLLTLLSAFAITFTGMSWYLGTYRECFSSSRVYHINMFIFISFFIYLGIWARSSF